VPTWSGMAFSAFVTDVYSRRIVGWRTASRMPTELPLDALEMALWVRECAGATVDGLIHHSDAGAQYTALRYTDRLADVGAGLHRQRRGLLRQCDGRERGGALQE
jgi:putative transposase